jgi:RNA polymerase sigma factor (sigma-70 family)
MLKQDEEFVVLISRIREGSEEAMLELVEKYSQHVHRAVRRKLNRAMRSKFDSEDFVQAVWASFFENRDRLLEFPSSRDLIMFLARIARNKVIDEIRRRFVMQGRNVNREVPLEQSGARKTLVSPGPTASEMMMADETFQQMTTRLPDRNRRIAELKRSGASHFEIAATLGIEPKTVQRVLRRLLREEDS